MYLIDFLAQRHVDINAISAITGLSRDDICSITMIPAFKKFSPDYKNLKNPGHLILAGRFEVEYRRFCPYCLGQNGIYKLLWQLSDIETCDVHHTPLLSECPECGEKQPYITDYLGALRCHKCMALLYRPDELSAETKCLESQLYLYEQWRYLLDDKAKGLTPNPDMNYQIQMACTLLFLLHDGYRGTHMHFRNLSGNDRKKIYNYIKNKDRAFFTPQRLIRYLSIAGLTVEQFFATDISSDFIEKLLRFLDIDKRALLKSEVKRNECKRYTIDDVKSLEVMSSVDNFLLQKELSKQITVKEVYGQLLYSDSCLPTYVIEYIWNRIDEYNQKYWDNLIKMIEKEVLILAEQGVVPTQQIIADRLGFHVMTIKRNPILREVVKNARGKAGI